MKTFNEANKAIDEVIEERSRFLKSQLEMLDAILFELKRDNPDVNVCLGGIQVSRDYFKHQLENPKELILIKEILKRIPNLDNQ